MVIFWRHLVEHGQHLRLGGGVLAYLGVEEERGEDGVDEGDVGAGMAEPTDSGDDAGAEHGAEVLGGLGRTERGAEPRQRLAAEQAGLAASGAQHGRCLREAPAGGVGGAPAVAPRLGLHGPREGVDLRESLEPLRQAVPEEARVRETREPDEEGVHVLRLIETPNEVEGETRGQPLHGVGIGGVSQRTEDAADEERVEVRRASEGLRQVRGSCSRRSAPVWRTNARRTS